MKQAIQTEYNPWLAQYLVMKRVSIEPNFHQLYSDFLKAVSPNVDFTCDANEFASNFDLFDFSKIDDSVLLSATRLLEQQENAENDNFSVIDDNTWASPGNYPGKGINLRQKKFHFFAQQTKNGDFLRF